MAKIQISEQAFPYPMPMVVVGTLVEGRFNFMAVGDEAGGVWGAGKGLIR